MQRPDAVAVSPDGADVKPAAVGATLHKLRHSGVRINQSSIGSDSNLDVLAEVLSASGALIGYVHAKGDHIVRVFMP